MPSFDDSKINISETAPSPTELKISRLYIIPPSDIEIEFEDDIGGGRAVKLQGATGSQVIELINNTNFSGSNKPLAQTIMDQVISYGLISGSSETAGFTELSLDFTDNGDGTYIMAVSGAAASSPIQAMITTQTNGLADFQ